MRRSVEEANCSSEVTAKPDGLLHRSFGFKSRGEHQAGHMVRHMTPEVGLGKPSSAFWALQPSEEQGDASRPLVIDELNRR